MTTLAANKQLPKVIGEENTVPVIASDIIYEGAAVGDNGSGYARPLVDGDRFLGHAIDKVDNSDGSAGDKNVRVLTGRYRREVALAGTITDVGQPVYASDDDTYSFIGVYSYVGVVSRYVSATKMEVEFRVGEYDEWGANPIRQLITDDLTTDIQDNGKIIYLGTKDKAVTLHATVAGCKITVVYCGQTGLDLEISVDPDGGDLFLGGCDMAAGGDGKRLTNTTATAKRGDYLQLLGDGSAGWNIIGKRGTWAQES